MKAARHIIHSLVAIIPLFSPYPVEAQQPPDEFNRNITTYGEIDVSDFPQCAYPHCITSSQLSPARLGCTSGQLTKTCLCQDALNPLECAATFPRDDENCWYELEDWLAKTCDNQLLMVHPNTIPDCMRNCALSVVSELGCPSLTQPCFCSLREEDVVKGVTKCIDQPGCSKYLDKFFSPNDWQNFVCNIGIDEEFDNEPLENLTSQRRIIKILVFIGTGIVAVAFSVGIFHCLKKMSSGWPAYLWTLLIILAFSAAAVVPVYFLL